MSILQDVTHLFFRKTSTNPQQRPVETYKQNLITFGQQMSTHLKLLRTLLGEVQTDSSLLQTLRPQIVNSVERFSLAFNSFSRLKKEYEGHNGKYYTVYTNYVYHLNIAYLGLNKYVDGVDKTISNALTSVNDSIRLLAQDMDTLDNIEAT